MTAFDVLTVGNAIVDIIARCDEAFITDNGIIKGAMNLIDAERAELLYSRMGPALEASGGSAGNTAAGVAASARLSRRASMALAVKPPKAAARPSVSSVGNGRMGPVVPVQGAVAPGAVC